MLMCVCVCMQKVSPCFLCSDPGHRSSECPNKYCNNCGLPGHLFSSCSERAYWHKQCHRCSKTGHFFDACPEIWRQYHITTRSGPPAKPSGSSNGRSSDYCYNCSRKGHLGHVCTRQRMFKGVYPNAPFINTYDTVKEIKSRQHRMKLKAKELEENGFFPSPANTPLTPDVPRKKQKFTSYKNNRTPRETHRNHRPTASHTFFHSDDDDAATPQKHKHKQKDICTSAKPWKPKRPVPSSRNPTPSKLVLDEADDFPRGGGGRGASSQKTRKRAFIQSVPPEGYNAGPAYPAWTGEQKKRRSKSKEEKNNKKNRNLAKKARKQQRPNDYPTDENLFTIKQRKRSR
uniref:Zinc finger CCHC domain-containing protein 7 n=1 Tax=Salarias fasciatus TaxID=181472 RepID=A0A672JAW8_SALFA